MSLSANEAAEAVGISKDGIIKAIKKGRISATKDDKGQWSIEPSELFRVYTAVESVHSGKIQPILSQSIEKSTPITPIESNYLEEKMQHLHEQLEYERKERQRERERAEEREDKAQQQIDKLTETISRQTLLLEHHQTKESTKVTEKAIEEQKPIAASEGSQSSSNTLLWAFIAVLACILGVVVTLLVRQDKFNLSGLFSTMIS